MATAAATATTSTKPTDEQIQRDVLAELKWDARLQPNEIGVIVKDGVVTLTAWVDSYGKKWAAEEAAHRVRGVKAVANDIEVRLPVSDERTDADIAAAAVRALEWDAFVPVEKLDVTVSKGWVTLRGRSGVAVSEGGRGAGCAAVVGGQWGDQPDCGQAPGDAVGAQAEDRAGAYTDGTDRRPADHSGGGGKQGDSEGQRALLGGARRSGASSVVGARGQLGGEPDRRRDLSLPLAAIA
jgi:osmotically-inducible protein OsmY